MPELGCAPPRVPCGGGEGGVGGGYDPQLDPCGAGGCAPQLAPSLPPLQSPQLFRRSLSVRWVDIPHICHFFYTGKFLGE